MVLKLWPGNARRKVCSRRLLHHDSHEQTSQSPQNRCIITVVGKFNNIVIRHTEALLFCYFSQHLTVVCSWNVQTQRLVPQTQQRHITKHWLHISARTFSIRHHKVLAQVTHTHNCLMLLSWVSWLIIIISLGSHSTLSRQISDGHRWLAKVEF